MDLDLSYPYIVTSIIVGAICGLIKLLLLFIYIASYCKQRQKDKDYHMQRRSSTTIKVNDNNSNSNKCIPSMDISLDILTILYVSISTISSACNIIYYFGIFFDYITCTFYIDCQATFWICYNYFKWIILLLRLYKVYGHTSKSILYRKYTIYTIIIFLGFYALFVMIVFIMNQSATLTRFKSLYGCDWKSAGWEQPSIALFDVIISILCLYLFYKPLKLVLNRRKETDPNNLNEVYSYKFKKLILKYSVLTYFCAITTILVTIMIILISSAKLLVIDVTINAICLMGMSKYYEKLFDNCCCCFIRCIMETNTSNDEVQLETVVNN